MPQPLRVLIVEDDLMQARAFALKLLKNTPPFEVEATRDAEKALDLLAEKRFDAVTLDHHLPAMSGLEALKAIKRRYPNLPVVMLTGQGDEQVAVQAMRAGAADYLTKAPEQIDMLPRVVERAVREVRLAQQLEESRRRYYDLFHDADLAIFVVDAATLQIVEVNRSAQSLLELPEDVILQKAFFNLVSPEQQSIFESFIEEIKKSGRAKAEGLLLLRKERRTTPVDVSGSLVQSGRRQLIELFASDVSEKLRLNRQLQLSRQRLLSLFNGITDLIGVLDGERRIQMANRRWVEHAGKAPKELIHQRCHQVLFGTDAPCSGCPAMETLADGKTRFLEVVHQAHVYHIWTFPMRNEAQQPEYIIEYVKDVTEQKEMERQLIKSEKMAAVGLLATGIAHELRNPLNIIESARYGIEMELAQRTPEIDKKLSVIRSNIQRASAIIDNLLYFARSSEFAKERVDVAETLHSTMALLLQEAERRGVRMSVVCPQEARAFVNLDSLKQVFLNLILNAVQAMPGGGELIVRCRTSGDRVIVEFEDTGVGISAENQKLLFTPFFTTKKPEEGTGLGLYISYMLMKREGGDISCSTAGKGTTFTVTLPAA